MANNTIYPFGTGGLIPSNIGIVNDLTTGGASSALSAEQGKNLKELISGKREAAAFYGVLADFSTTNYPSLDLSTCKGLSFLFDRRYPAENWNGSTDDSVESGTYLSVSKDTNNSFWLSQSGWQFTAGLKNAGTTIFNTIFTTGATGGTPNVQEHIVVCIDFTIPEVNYYTNGELVKTTSLGSSDVSSYLSEFTNIKIQRTGKWGAMGAALFNSCLTASEVSDLYNAGSYVEWLIPNEYVANKFVSTSYSFANSYAANSSKETLSNKTASSVDVVGSGSNSNAYVCSGNPNIPSTVETKNSEMRLHISMTSGSISTVGFGTNGRWKPTVYDLTANETLTAAGPLVAGHEYDLVATGIAKAGTASQYILNYVYTEAISMTVSNWTIKQVGAPVVCAPQNFNGEAFVQESGDAIPTSCTVYYEPIKKRVVKYNSNHPPQFSGQMAIDFTNSKVYIGINKGTSKVWKQISNA